MKMKTAEEKRYGMVSDLEVMFLTSVQHPA